MGNGNHNHTLTRPVLVLNQNYEPLSVCTTRRAVVLVYLGKAEMIERPEGHEIRTPPRGLLPPSVARPGRHWPHLNMQPVGNPGRSIVLHGSRRPQRQSGAHSPHCLKKKATPAATH